jgi:hypothetical protein
MTSSPHIPAPPASARTAIQAVLRRSFATTDAFHHAARAFRNRLVVMTGVTVVVGTALIVVQWRIPAAAIVQQPDGSTNLSRWAVLLLVMVFGAVGALVSTIPAIAAIPRVSSPFNFPLQQAFLKIALGSLTAVVGVVATGSAGFSKGYANLEALIGVAVVFGAAQQAVTQFLDKRAGQLVASKPG